MKNIRLPNTPRQIRALKAIAQKATSRHDLDIIAGAENSPEVVSQLKKRGFDIQCKRVPIIDRDGRVTHKGIYYLEKEAVQVAWLAINKLEKGAKNE